MALLKQIHGEIGAIVYGPAIVTLSEISTALGEEVERAVGLIDLQTGYLAGQSYNKIFAAFKSLAHVFHTLLVS